MKITGDTPADGKTKDVEIIVPLKYLSIFWRTLEIPLLIVKLFLFWHGHQLVLLLFYRWRKICNNRYRTYVPVVTLSTQDHTKLLQQLKSFFERLTAA